MDDDRQVPLRSSHEPEGRGSAVGRRPVATDVPARPEAPRRAQPIDAVLIGASTGGPEALHELLAALDVDVPILVVQHMPEFFTQLLAERLDQESALRVREGFDGLAVGPGDCALAPGGSHMSCEVAPGGLRVRTNQNPPEHSCRPAVDVLFRSAAVALGPRCLAVVLTGLGRDGAAGAAELHRLGAPVLVQDRDSSAVWGMPGAVVEAGAADQVLPLDRLAAWINTAVWSRCESSRRSA